MPQTTQCTVCLDPRLELIDAAIISNVMSTRRVAAHFGLGPSSVIRHRNHHVGRPRPTAPQASGDDEPVDTDSDVDGIATLEQLLRDLKRVKRDDLSPRDRLQHDELVRKASADLARAKPPADREGPASLEAKRLGEVVRTVAKVLERHPEVKAEVAVAMRDAGL